jgi:D-beta-D-heptose 7-phosphate kinase/D-beta-D-heptose 1-phosphate adenosyltransferase
MSQADQGVLIARAEAEDLIRRMARCQVLVVGDLMLDEYLWGQITRISPEAPVPVLHLQRSYRSLGGAANVARNIVSPGAHAWAIGMVGNDAAGTELLQCLKRTGIESAAVTEATRPTTRKCRLISVEHGQQVFRFDDEVSEEIGAEIEERLISILRKRVPLADVVVCSDYLKGVLTSRILSEIAALAQDHGVPLITAPKDTVPGKYAGASVLMPNLREFAGFAGKKWSGDESATWLDPAALNLLNAYGFDALLVTRGRQGMTLFEVADGSLRRQHVSAVTQHVYDVTGAGDTALGVFALAVAAGAPYAGAASLANIAAGIVAGKRGTAFVTPKDLLQRVNELEVVSSGIHEEAVQTG